MATIIVADRTAEAKTSRNRICGVDLKENVMNFKTKVSSSINKDDTEFGKHLIVHRTQQNPPIYLFITFSVSVSYDNGRHL